ncbi:PAS domain S-box protein, partial [candidate division KSB1 bacterium]|nr:PAS domain S-box protein [candidate division KSB1 bacterium]
MRDELKSKKQLIQELKQSREKCSELESNVTKIRDQEKAEKEAERYIEELTFLSDAAFEFATLSGDEDFYQFTGRKLKKITGNSIVMINAFDETDSSLHLKYIGGLGKYTNDVIRLLGRRLHDYSVTLNNEVARNDLLKGKLVLVKGRLYELSFGEIPRTVCNSIEKLLRMGTFYAMGMTRNNVLYGNVIIVTRDKEQLVNQNIIEAFINQVTVAYERKRAEDALKLNEEKFRTIFEQSPIAIQLYDATGLLIDANPECLVLFGVQHVSKIKDYDLFEYPNIINANRERLNAGETIKYETEFDFESIKKNRLYKTTKSGKSNFYVIINPLMINSDHPYGYLVLIQDITRRKEYEAEMLKAEKLGSIGVLAGGIAHDFNNLLTGIIGNVSLAKLYENSWDDVIELLNEAENASFKARNLTQQLLTFSKGGAPVKKLMSIQDLVKDTAIFVLRGSKSRCEFFIDENLWSVEMDEGQISQVIQNIVLNAEQAMPDGGKIMIRCENVEIQEEDSGSIKTGKYVKIFVRDSGIGISKKNLKRIFDPYFTTKKNGNGLG